MEVESKNMQRKLEFFTSEGVRVVRRSTATTTERGHADRSHSTASNEPSGGQKWEKGEKGR